MLNSLKIKVMMIAPLVASNLPTLGENIRNQVVGLVSGLIVAVFAIKILKSVGDNNFTKTIISIVAGALVYFTVTNFDLVASFFVNVFKSFLG